MKVIGDYLNDLSAKGLLKAITFNNRFYFIDRECILQDSDTLHYTRSLVACRNRLATEVLR